MRRLTVEPVIQNACGKAVDAVLAPPVHYIGAKYLPGVVESSIVQVDDAQLFSQRLRPEYSLRLLPREGAPRAILGGVYPDTWLNELVKVNVYQLLL